MDTININVDISEPLKKLATLNSPRVRRRAMVNMKSAIARELKNRALENAKTGATSFKDGPNPPGLRHSMKKAKDAIKTTRRGNVFVAAGRTNPYSPHAHLVEFGHNSPRNGPVRGKFFMREAGESVARDALDIAVKSINKTLDKHLPS